MTPTAPGEPTSRRHTSILGNVVRGALIGTVETVPGVSGGTVALVVGIYHELIGSASSLVSAAKTLITGPDRAAGARARLAEVQWRVLLPVMAGMAAAVLTVAGPMADAVEHHPTLMRGLFLGMVLASVAVPVRMITASIGAVPLGSRTRRQRPLRLLAVGVVAAVLTFLLVSLEPTRLTPHPLVIVAAAAIAVSALVLPGLSGSFLLLTLGLYQPTLRAVDTLDLGYLGLFATGAVVGLAVVVKALQVLLARYEAMTLSALAGLMVGGLRALWPWQSDGGTLLAPGAQLGAVVGLGLLGFAVVLGLVVVDEMVTRRGAAQQVREEIAQTLATG
ncbi:DUF368 domain-containing protein [Actinomyces respiraculi]|uniref:DUF368 domain-containing protein n=1 Tax=Actinomyces respiraculi TaxID=2744574 RepID=UPI0018E067E5|nr:DUF368 domain-containing protein [Actinomyces respiraculi]